MKVEFPTPYGTISAFIHDANHVRLTGVVTINGVEYNIDTELKNKEEEWYLSSIIRMRRTDHSNKWSHKAHDKLYNSLVEMWKKFITPTIISQAVDEVNANTIIRLRKEADELLSKLEAKETELQEFLAKSSESVKLLADTLMRENP